MSQNATIARPQISARQAITQAMGDSDSYVIELEYTDAKGQVSRRVVSPIRFVAPDRFMALCLCREEPRVFKVKKCSKVSLQGAWNYLMPVEMVTC